MSDLTSISPNRYFCIITQRWKCRLCERKLHGGWILSFHNKKQHFTHSLRSFMKYCFYHVLENKIHIFAPSGNIVYIINRERWIWNIINWYPASPSRIIVLWKNQPHFSYKINKERKKLEKRWKGTRIDHMTDRKRRQNLAKCSYNVSLQSWMNQWISPKVNELAQVLEKNILIIGFEILYVFDFF